MTTPKFQIVEDREFQQQTEEVAASSFYKAMTFLIEDRTASMTKLHNTALSQMKHLIETTHGPMNPHELHTLGEVIKAAEFYGSQIVELQGIKARVLNGYLKAKSAPELVTATD